MTKKTKKAATILTAADILAAQDYEAKVVDVPEWGGAVYARPLTARERDKFEMSVGGSGAADMDNFRARLVVLCLVDGDGNRLFTDEQANDLGEKAASVVNRLFDVCRELNGMSDTDVAEMEKN